MPPTSSNDIRIRRARPADATALAGLHVAAWREAYAGILPPDFLAGLDPDARARSWRAILSRPSEGSETRLAVGHGGLVGFANWMPSRDPGAGPDVGELAAIYIRRGAWDSGLGARLHDLCIDELMAAGFTCATLWVLRDNARASTFYERRGWRPDGGSRVETSGAVEFHEVRYAIDLQFEPVRRAARLMRGYDGRWAITGGWALDLHLGQVTRPHSDLDMAVLRREQRFLREHLHGWRFKVVLPLATAKLKGWRGGWLSAPTFEVHARRRAGNPRELELLLSETDETDWIYRRDPGVRRPLYRAILTSGEGIPYLAPELILLFKSRAPRDRDHDDLAAALPHLGAEAREWLIATLRQTGGDPTWVGAAQAG